MAPHAPHNHHRHPLATALLSALTLAMLMLPAAAAQAHDVMEGTSPANGSTVASVPASIGMTFDHTPIAIGSEILVNDAHGSNWASGAVNIVDNHVIQALKPSAPAGKYTVEWRIVSSDSHPIEGTFTFTALRPAGNPTPAAGPGTPASAQSTAVAAAAAGGGGIPWGVVGLGAGVLLVAIALLWAARRLIARTEGD
ncbi:hypothetical protein B5P43_32895 [Bacillus sp. SRB_336]|nr:hypothetical protein B5P43_32895 [Bacillus sp. SRB_336]